MRKLNVLMIDDNPEFLAAARNLIAALPGMADMACATSGADALAQIGRLHCDLVLTDLSMPEMSGFELIRKLRSGDPPPRVFAVTLHDGAEFRAAVLRSGAEGLISKRDFGTRVPALIASLARAGGA
jgi:DNA-binding NarL/FixJ family response regulator